MMNSVDIYIRTCPVPYKYKGELHSGIVLHQDKYCLECKDCLCKDAPLAESFIKCPSKMLVKKFFKSDVEILLYGFTEKTDKYSRNPIDINIVDTWLQGLNNIINIQNEQKKMMWEPFHDITPCISLLFRNIESIIVQYPGDTINEKIENQEKPVPPNIIRLFKTASLLDEQLKMIRYGSSEEQISAGKKRAFPIYKVVDKIQKIFKVVAAERNLSIELAGNSFNAPFLLDSFSSIPFILLDNAIKYTFPHESINIEIFDIDEGGVEFSITSLSAVCDEHIFEKRHRGRYSDRLTDRGLGMGLYVAKKICEANNAIIKHIAKKGSNIKIDNIEYCINTFIVRVGEI